MTIQQLISYLEQREEQDFTVFSDFTLPPGEVCVVKDRIYVSPYLFAKLEEETSYALN